MTHPLDLLEQHRLPGLPEPLPSVVIDSHTHADTTEEHSHLDPDASLALAASVGIAGFVQVGCDVPGSEYAVDLAARRPEVVAAVAIHPNDAARAGDGLEAMIERIDALAASGPHVRAVGETGLDYYRTREPAGHQAQRHSFARHIDIARRHDLTLVIHDRDAHDDVLAVLDAEPPAPRVVMHAFSGDADVARAFLDRGAWLSFPGVVTFANAPALREALRVVPLDRILVETDAPYLTPVPARGRPNAPYLVPHLVRFVAEQLARPLDEVCAALLANTHAAFGGAWDHPDAVIPLRDRA
ncbi:MAG TPA: TatD family hydrolase [Propionibacteriaceae bacterium]|nr:TatD family hydrolase [Propionibacteriaceae bacterium]